MKGPHMKHRRKLNGFQNTNSGHVVLVIDKTRIIERLEYPTYGKAMWGVLAMEEQYPGMEVEYRDVRTFREDTYE
jgi:hypothetical protein